MALQLRGTLSRIGRWPRLLAAAACLVLAMLSALDTGRGAAAPSADEVPVVVAARTMAAGHVLRSRDLTVVHWPRRLRPPGAARRVHALIGERLAGPVAAREAVTGTRLIGAELTGGLDAGLAAVSVELGDAHAGDLVHPGDRVDLLATPREDITDGPVDGSVMQVGSRLLTLAVLPAVGDDGDGGSTDVVVAADRATTLRIARVGSAQIFTAVVVSP